MKSKTEVMEMIAKITAIAKTTAKTLTDEAALDVPFLFPSWKIGVNYDAGVRIYHVGALYKCIQMHTSQAGWEPGIAHSLWAEVLTNPGVILDWKQPDSTNPYMKGDKVQYDGKTWVSTADNNVWAPGVYGWEVIA